MPVIFCFILAFKRYYFLSFVGATGVVSAFLSDEQQDFLSDEAQDFFCSAVHSVFAFLELSSFVEALTVEAAKPIVNATARTIANFFML